jgi:hypothetical protein
MRIASTLLFGSTLLAGALTASAAAADCTCRAGGRDYDLGRSVCLNTPAGFRLATCGMVLNNTSWKISAMPCVDAAAAPIEPPPTAGHSHAHRRGG